MKRRYRETHASDIAEYKRRKYNESLEKSREYLRARRAADPERFKSYSERETEKRRHGGWHTFYKYGLTPKAREALVSEQGNACALCARPLSEVREHVDHDHETGYIRGILCPGCNTKLGWYERNRDRLQRYLSKPHIAPVAGPRRRTEHM